MSIYLLLIERVHCISQLQYCEVHNDKLHGIKIYHIAIDMYHKLSAHHVTTQRHRPANILVLLNQWSVT